MYNIVHNGVLGEGTDLCIRYPKLDIYTLDVLCICNFASIYRKNISKNSLNANDDNFWRQKL